MKTYMHKTADVTRAWHLFDAKDQVLGRLATQIAKKLIGKDKPTYTPHIDDGDMVVVINAKDVALTRNKASQKMYYRHSGFPGGLKAVSFAEMIEKTPERVIEHAVKNMLPKNKLQADRMARLKVFAGGEHPYQPQLTHQDKKQATK